MQRRWWSKCRCCRKNLSQTNIIQKKEGNPPFFVHEKIVNNRAIVDYFRTEYTTKFIIWTNCSMQIYLNIKHQTIQFLPFAIIKLQIAFIKQYFAIQNKPKAHQSILH
jgi:hypothetical protein